MEIYKKDKPCYNATKVLMVDFVILLEGLFLLPCS